MKVFEVSGDLRVHKCSVLEVLAISFSRGAQRAPKIDFLMLFGGLEGSWGVLLDMLEGLWIF